MLDQNNDLNNEAVQREIDSTREGDTLEFSHSQEIPGPLVLGRKLIIDGHGATIWALKGPAMTITSPGVVLRNLRIEVTEDHAQAPNNEDCALLVQPGVDVKLENMEVRGVVIGLKTEAGQWYYPRALNIGLLAHSQAYDLILRIHVPVPCRISSDIAGLEAWPSILTPGQNEIHLKLSALPKDCFLVGNLFLATDLLKRQIPINGCVSSGLPDSDQPQTVSGATIWEPGFLLVTAAEPTEGGRIHGGGACSKDANVSLQAIANPKWQFKRWTGDFKGIKNPTNISMDRDKTITANFERNSFVLSSTAEPKDGGVVQGEGEFARDREVTVQAKENPKWQFGRWSGDLAGSDNPAKMLMDRDKAIVAHFDKIRMVLTASADPSAGGKVSGAGEYPKGNGVLVEAKPSVKWRFDRWSGDAAGAVNPLSIPLDDDKKITAHFVQIRTFKLTVISSKGGTVQGAGDYDEGKLVTLQATPKNNWRFAQWTGALTGPASAASLVIDKDKSVCAQFIRAGTVKERVLAALNSPLVILPFCSSLTLLDLLWLWRRAVELKLGIHSPTLEVAAAGLGALGVVCLLRRFIS